MFRAARRTLSLTASKAMGGASPAASSAEQAALYTKCAEHMNKGYYRSHQIHFETGKGAYVWDVHGEKKLDFSCGIGVTNLGHCHPRLVKVAQDQCAKIWHAQCSLGISTAMADAMDQLLSILPPELNRVGFVSSGSEAVEALIRISKMTTKRQNIVVLQGGYHGRTAGAAGLSSSKYSYSYGARPLIPGVYHVPFPYWSQMHVDPHTSMEELSNRCLGIMHDLLHQVVHPSEVAMIISEPVLGECGYIPMPSSFAKGLRSFCDKHGILLAFDEVQAGFGRVGGFFAFQQLGVLPDLVCFAKGIANGLPLAGTACRAEVGDKCPPGTQGGTYSGNAIACATAGEAIRMMKEKGIFDNVQIRGEQLVNGLKAIAMRHSLPVQEVRGRGLMIGMQFRVDVPAGTALKVALKANDLGLIVVPSGIYETLRIIPPLNVSEAEIDEGLGLIEKALVDVCGALPKTPIGSFAPCCASPCWLPMNGASVTGNNLCCRQIAK